jgi:hypothetical protein
VIHWYRFGAPAEGGRPDPLLDRFVWTLAAQPTGSAASVAHTETRVWMTDGAARSRFRRYWALVSPGVVLIRRQSLRIVKADAEQRSRAFPGRAN